MAETPVLLDTGPLISFINRHEHYHPWAVSNFESLPVPLITCEAVITECVFLLNRSGISLSSLFELLEAQAISIAFDLQSEHVPVAALLNKYSALPKGAAMSLADASLVRLSEQYDGSPVFTLDRHFRIYRRNGRQLIPLIIPEDVR